MRRGVGPGRTRDEHLDLAGQMLSLLSQARDARELAELLGDSALSPTERDYLRYAELFYTEFVDQGSHQALSLEETMTRAWHVASLLPRRELTMVAPRHLDEYYESRGQPADGAQQ
jgi:V/A-type H+-transporting ATPase subunit B